MLVRFCTACLLALSLCRVTAATEITIDFESLLPANSYENGANLSGGFTLQGVAFNNYFDNTFGPYWEGWSYSTMTDTTTDGFTNQHSAFAGSGDNSAGYGVAFTGGFTLSPIITLPDDHKPVSMRITNSTYAALAIRDGKDGGFNGVRQFSDGDWFKLEINGRDSNGDPIGPAVEYYLADYRNGGSYLASDWVEIDLLSLAGAKTLGFELTSTDNHPQFGMNTPAYFAMDNLVVQHLPEPAGSMIAAVAVVGLIVARRCQKLAATLSLGV